MARPIDIRLTQDANNQFDIGFSSTGDFDMVDGFDTSLQMSLFAERRADPSEVSDPLNRRGWIGNSLADQQGFEIGSKLWLYYQSRLNNGTINGVKDAARKATQWFIDDGYAKNITADVVANNPDNLSLKMTIEFSSGIVEQRFYDLWLETGK